MNKNIIILILFSLTFLHVKGQEGNQEHNIFTQKNKKIVNSANTQDQLIYFNFNEEKLVDIVNRLAAYKQINILLPTNQQKLTETTVTFRVAHKIKLYDAWEMTVSMLDIAGFSVTKISNRLYKIEPNTTIGKQPAPLYINVPSDVLPNSNSIIRYLFYFQNIYIKEKGASDNLKNILKDMLPMQNAEQNFSLDENYNSLLITAPANIIKGIINIIRELDQSGFREAIEVIPILHTSSHEIISIFDELIPSKKEEDHFRFPPLINEPSHEGKTYFSASTRIVSIDQTNSVAIFGLYESVQRVKDFIRKYLDKKVDAEKTVLHFKPLQYLNAEKFADTLTNLIERKGQEAQSTDEKKEKILSDVIVVAEKETIAKKGKERELIAEAQDIGPKLENAKKGKEGPILGGNNLIIACNQKDWKVLNALIDHLDVEQWQVAIEVLIVDMTIESSNLLGTQLRRITHDTNPHEFKWQVAQIERPLLDYTSDISQPTDKINPTAGIESDLLSGQAPIIKDESSFNIASNATPGTTIFSFKDDNGMAAIIKLLRKFNDAKIISQPFVVARNNEEANILDLETRMVRGEADQKSIGGSVIIKYEPMKAATEVKILPRISKPADNINLEINVSANEFVGPQEIRKRVILTNANVGHKEVLVLGGISKLQIDDTLYETPILSRIPIIGYLFKQQSVRHDQRNLMIFISPSRIPPISLSGNSINKFTHKKIDLLSDKLRKDSRYFGCPAQYVQKHENFQCLGDPITNFLFHPDEGEWLSNTLENYAERGIWTQAITNPKKETKSTAQKKSESKKAKSIISHTNKKDKLKKLLKHQENPFKSKT